MKKYANIVSVRLVREGRVPGRTISGPKDAADFVRPLYADFPNEVFSVIILNSANSVTDWSIVTSGILNSSLVHPREVFQRVILANGAGFIAVHNHPSGSLTPSAEDRQLTKTLYEASKILIPMHDHIIISSLPNSSGYFSFSEQGLI